MTAQITIRGARLHNLKNISLAIPKNQLVVFTGVSGSGKSTLGFDILYKEGQRQYLESLGILPFNLARPPVDAIEGLSPSISIDQSLTSRSPRSTVGTVTDVFTYLRVLYARLGHRSCPNCGEDVPPPQTSRAEEQQGVMDGSDDADDENEKYSCPHCGTPIHVLRMANFSFNKPAGACPSCTGLGVLQQVDIARLVDEQKSILEGGVIGWDAFHIDYYNSILHAAAAYYAIAYDISLAIKEYSPALRDLLFYGVESPSFQRHFPGKKMPTTVRAGHFEGLATNLLRRYAERIEDTDYRQKMEGYLVTQTCPDCSGTRLRAEIRAVTVNGWTIIELSRLPIIELKTWVESLTGVLTPDELLIAEPILLDINKRLTNLWSAGAGYLSLERSTPTLSAGETQRLRLATLLGSSLTGVLYVFDEPTIGTHQRDTRRLIELLRHLRDLGNTVVVIEHDLEMIAAADHIVDFGAGGGKYGGQVVACGTPQEVAAHCESLTGGYLSGRVSIPTPQHRRPITDACITIRGARHNNLQNFTVNIPLGMLVAVTGVSGSGKSSLIFDILDRALRQRLYGSGEKPGEHDAIAGADLIDRVITIDQQHIGRIPRSNVATYTEVYTPIRESFSATIEAQRRGFLARHFSFNVPGGRCERCQGTGFLLVNMHFLPDAEVRCPACHGQRFTAETLAVTYHNYDISQVLELTVDEARQLFAEIPSAYSRLKMLSDVGLGYLQLGQPATTLSGGEAQRVKLARELARRATRRTLYLLDEPTTGLHLADTARLLAVLQRLVDAGNSVVVVEHNLQLIKAADWIIDLGPEGGGAGGNLIAQGTPEQVAQIAQSYTGQYLKEILLKI